jgi:phospholipid transport system substrate-binding protein
VSRNTISMNQHGQGKLVMDSRSRPISRRGLLGLAQALPAAMLLTPTMAYADDRQLVTQVANEALAVARAGGSPSRFRSLLQRYSAYQGVAMFALGRYRKQLPESKRDRYVGLALNFVASTFARNSKSFAGERFVATSAGDGTVRGKIQFANGQSANVDWRVRGGKIIDVNIQGVWLTLQLRDQFTGVLGRNNGDFDALFKYLQTGRA